MCFMQVIFIFKSSQERSFGDESLITTQYWNTFFTTFAQILQIKRSHLISPDKITAKFSKAGNQKNQRC